MFAGNIVKFCLVQFKLSVMCLKDADGMANSVDAVFSGSTVFNQTCLSKNVMVYHYL